MEIPNLPTDNLYKFIALSGVFIIVFFISMYVLRSTKLRENLDKITTEIGELQFEKLLLIEKDSILNVDLKDLESKLDRYKTGSTELKFDLSEISKPILDPNKREAFRFFFTYESEILPERKILDDILLRKKLSDENEEKLRIKTNKIYLMSNQTIEDIKSLRRFSILMSLGIFIGSFLAINGFILWYQKVQKYLDIRIRKDSESR